MQCPKQDGGGGSLNEPVSGSGPAAEDSVMSGLLWSWTAMPQRRQVAASLWHGVPATRSVMLLGLRLCVINGLVP